MKKLGYLFLLGGVLSLLTVLFAAKDWRAFMTNAQQPTRDRGFPTCRETRRDDPNARRRALAHADLYAEESGGTIAHSDEQNAVWSWPGEFRGRQSPLSRTGQGRLHFRVSGYSR